MTWATRCQMYIMCMSKTDHVADMMIGFSIFYSLRRLVFPKVERVYCDEEII